MSRFDFALNKKEENSYDAYWAKKTDYSRKKQFRMTSVGISSLLMVFVILCLACFAALAVVSAAADKKLTDKLADRTTAYYGASNEAERWMAGLEIDEIRVVTRDFPVSDTQILRVMVEGVEAEKGEPGGLKVLSRKIISPENSGDVTEIR